MCISELESKVIWFDYFGVSNDFIIETFSKSFTLKRKKDKFNDDLSLRDFLFSSLIVNVRRTKTKRHARKTFFSNAKGNFIHLDKRINKIR